MSLNEYPGFTKAKAAFEFDPHCRACGREVDTVNSLTGVMCEFCCVIWYDCAPPDGDTHWNPDTLGAECKRREKISEYPFKGNVDKCLFEPDGLC